MHGYIDSIPVPVNLPPSNPKGKNKKEANEKTEAFDITSNWNSAEKDSIQRRVLMASTLGYSTVVLIISISPNVNPASISFPTPLFPELDPRTNEEGSVLQLWRIQVKDLSDEAIKSTGVKGYYGFSNSTASLYPEGVSLLSTVPTSANVFSHLAISLSPPSPFAPSIITFNPSLSPRLPFVLKRGLVNSLLRNGVYFEIILRGMVSASETLANSSDRRRNWIAGAREIVRATDGCNIIISTGAETPAEMRAAEDIINLCGLIGLTPEKASEALSTNPKKAIIRGLSLRQTYRGVVSNPTITLTTTSKRTLFQEQEQSIKRKK